MQRSIRTKDDRLRPTPQNQLVHTHKIATKLSAMGSFINYGFNCEGVYLDEFIATIRARLSNWSLIFAFHSQEIPEPQQPSLVFLSGQEDHSLENKVCEYEQVKLVFRQHFPLVPVSNPKVRPIPLTPIVDFDHNAKILPISERPYDYFWAGVRNMNRQSLESALSQYALSNPNGQVFWSETWGKGINKQQYAYYLANSKISFAPRGWVSPETYRYYEILRSGCIAVSVPQPDFWYNERSSHVWCGNWERLPELLERLLANPKLLDELQKYSLEFYQRCCTPSAVADYVCQEVAALGFK